MRRDYFSRAEFRAFVRDEVAEGNGDPEPDEVDAPDYSDDEIDRAQTEVIERLEDWASSAWPTVDAKAEEDGDGFTNAPRRVTEVFDAGGDRLHLGFVPVLGIETFHFNGTELEEGAYDPYLTEGIIRFTRGFRSHPLAFSITYTYGHTATPWSIKRPAMVAAATLLDQQKGRSEFPAGAESVTSEGTTIRFAVNDKPNEPFPWDRAASVDIVTAWGRHRPRLVGVA